ncbi:hypothetical protein, partial [Erwinia billingiae]|uniref:hypothetical protein n=1 Tax=Erwinia billingiae TaxID=182337 RepID=UPI001A7EC167
APVISAACNDAPLFIYTGLSTSIPMIGIQIPLIPYGLHGLLMSSILSRKTVDRISIKGVQDDHDSADASSQRCLDEPELVMRLSADQFTTIVPLC